MQETMTKLETLEEVVGFCQENDLPGEVVGHWVWIEFDAKPSEEIREKLKGAGFRWVQRRGRWAHNCGVPSRKGKEDPRNVYGAIPIYKRRRLEDDED